MKKQIFTIILLLMGGVAAFGQSFKLDATGANDMRLRTGNVDRLTILPTTGNVGIGTTTPNAKLDVFGDLSFTKKRNLTTSGIQNALDRQGASRIFIDVSSTVTLNGIAGGVDGLMIFIYTGSGTTLVINNLDVAAISADRIATHTGGTVTITARGGTSLIYDGATGNWRIYGFADENSSWNSKGNAGTVPSTNFIGTTDNQSFVTKTNNVERMRVLSNGNVGIGTTTPTATLDVNGEIKVARLYFPVGGGGTVTLDPLNRQSKSFVWLNLTVGTNAIIKGFSAPNPSNPFDGYGTLLFFHIGGVNTVTIEHNAATIPTNGIWTNTGGNLILTNSGSATFIYDDGGWWLLSYAQ